jgi:hypothetical protein
MAKKLKIDCPTCGKVLRGATSDMLGDVGVCPVCKAEFRILTDGATEPESTIGDPNRTSAQDESGTECNGGRLRRFERIYFLPLALVALSALFPLVLFLLTRSGAQSGAAPGRVALFGLPGHVAGPLFATVWGLLAAASWISAYGVTLYITLRKRFVVDAWSTALWLAVAFTLPPIGLLVYLFALCRRPVSEPEYLGELTRRLEDADPAVREVAQRRLRSLPRTAAVESAIAKTEQAEQETAAKLEQLPDIPLKKAIRIERNFAAWSTILALWLFFGFFGHFAAFSNYNEYSTAVKNLGSSYFQPKREFAERVARIRSHLSALERLEDYILVAAIVAIPVWLAVFPARKGFTRRQQDGPVWLCLVLIAWIAVHLYGAYLTLSIPEADVMGFVDVFRIRAYPFIFALFALTLLPCFCGTARIYYQWTAVDNTCFRKHGIGRRVLERRDPNGALALLNAPQWYHVLAAVLFPYVGLPWGIVNIARGKRRSGWVLVSLSLVVFLVALLIGLVSVRINT